MRRRDFVAALASAALARSAIAQANERKRVGVLMSTAETDPREHAAVAAFIGALAEFGWVEGRTRQATSTIPLVFVVVGDAGAQQFVPNFARPGGNITGFTSNELTMAGSASSSCAK